MWTQILILAFVAILFSFTNLFGQTDSSNKTTENTSSKTILDFTKTVNPRPDLAGKEDTEKRENELTPLNKVIFTSLQEDNTNEDSEIIEKNSGSFNEVINPVLTTDPKKE